MPVIVCRSGDCHVEEVLVYSCGERVSGEEKLFCLSQLNGMVLVFFNPTKMADMYFAMSRHTTDVVIQATKGKSPLELDAHISQLKGVWMKAWKVI